MDLTSGHEYKKSKIYKLHELLTLSTSKSLKTLGSELWLWQGVKFAKLHFEVTSLNPISGRLLATPISGKGGCLGSPLDISGSYRLIFKIQTAFVSPQHDLHF